MQPQGLCFPSPRVLFDDPPDCPTREIMEFRLVYAGELLKAAGYGKSRAWEKHQIRRYLHRQLTNLLGDSPATHFLFAGGAF